MVRQAPRATWLRERADGCRAKAKNNPFKSAELIRMASAYEALARQVPKGVEVGELHLKQLKSKRSRVG